MKLGFFTMPIHPVGKDWRQCLREDREAFLLADELGYCEAYTGEHSTDLAENITSCTMFLASLAGQVKQMTLGTGTVNMPNTHPARVAAEIAMLDHMLDGKFIMGISPGGLLSDAEVFGNLGKNRNEMFLESINAVLQIWSSEAPYNIEGKYWNITTQQTLMKEIGQGSLPKPLQRPHPPIVVTAVAPYSKGVTEAAARGMTASLVIELLALGLAAGFLAGLLGIGGGLVATPIFTSWFGQRQAMAQSFSLANMVPQAIKQNSGPWARIEKDTRSYAQRAQGDVYVITGPVFDDDAATVGNNQVRVPSFLYKLVYDAQSQRAWAHWQANDDAARVSQPISYAELVRRTGIEFLPGTPLQTSGKLQQASAPGMQHH